LTGAILLANERSFNMRVEGKMVKAVGSTQLSVRRGPAADEGDTARRILNAAYRLFVAHGYHGTSMRRIAAEADIALGGVYNHFPGKRQLFSAVLLEFHPYREVIPAIEAAGGDTLEAAVRDAAHRLMATMRGRPDFINLILIEVVEMHGENLPELFAAILPRLSAAMQRLTAAGSGLRALPPAVVMRAFVGMFFSYVITEQMLSPATLSAFPPDTLEHFVDIFLHGVVDPDRVGPGSAD
jgi:AcrR family transcriptional regulator